MEEKRKRRRKRKKNKVSIELIQHDNHSYKKKIHYTLTKDISLNGIKIIIDTPLPVNSLLKIKLMLEKTHRLVIVIGKVVWTKSIGRNNLHETGLEFVDTSQENIMALMEHIYGEIPVS